MDTPKLLDEQQVREHFRLVDEGVKRSAPVLKEIEERQRAIQRLNPHLPPAPPDPPVAGDLPRAFTWENHGGVTDVQNQHSAGTCFAFAHVGSIEAAYRIRYGHVYDLAEQDLIDCGRKGYPDRQLEGVRFETENPYQKKDAPDEPTPRCKHIRTPFAVDGLRYADPDYVPHQEHEKMQPVATHLIKKAIFDHGPGVICMFIPDVEGGVKSAFLHHYDGTSVFKEEIPLTYHPSNYQSHIIVVVGWDTPRARGVSRTRGARAGATRAMGGSLTAATRSAWVPTLFGCTCPISSPLRSGRKATKRSTTSTRGRPPSISR